MADLVLFEEEFVKIQNLLERLRADASGRIVFLLDRNGQPIAHAGDMRDIDPTSLASLAAGNVAATEGLAQLVGEQEFANLYHEGERDNLHLTVVGQRVILVVIFDECSSLGLVRLRVRKASSELAVLIREVEERGQAELVHAGAEGGFAGITDADLDALFKD